MFIMQYYCCLQGYFTVLMSFTLILWVPATKRTNMLVYTLNTHNYYFFVTNNQIFISSTFLSWEKKTKIEILSSCRNHLLCK